MTHDPDRAHPVNHWIVVADATRAQVFESGVMLDVLAPVDAHVHPGGRLHPDDLVEGARGATRERAGAAHSRLEPHTGAHQVEVDAFARELAALVHDARIAGRFDRLVIVAPPTFLGALRAALDTETARTVIATIAHDWTRLPLADLTHRVHDAVAADARVPA